MNFLNCPCILVWVIDLVWMESPSGFFHSMFHVWYWSARNSSSLVLAAVQRSGMSEPHGVPVSFPGVAKFCGFPHSGSPCVWISTGSQCVWPVSETCSLQCPSVLMSWKFCCFSLISRMSRALMLHQSKCTVKSSSAWSIHVMNCLIGFWDIITHVSIYPWEIDNSVVWAVLIGGPVITKINLMLKLTFLSFPEITPYPLVVISHLPSSPPLEGISLLLISLDWPFLQNSPEWNCRPQCSWTHYVAFVKDSFQSA